MSDYQRVKTRDVTSAMHAVGLAYSALSIYLFSAEEIGGIRKTEQRIREIQNLYNEVANLVALFAPVPPKEYEAEVMAAQLDAMGDPPLKLVSWHDHEPDED